MSVIVKDLLLALTDGDGDTNALAAMRTASTATRGCVNGHWALGSVTRKLLQSTTWPVLFSH